LVAEAFLATEDGREMLGWDGGAAARALLSVVLIDTVNLDPRAKKVTERDIVAAHTLQQFAPMPPIPALFARLDDAKFDRAFWHSLTAAQALRYDYKAFGISCGTLGLSSVLCSFSDLVEKKGFLEEMRQRSSKVALYGIMTFTRGDRGMRRELALVSTNSTRTSRTNDFLLAWDAPPLELHVLDVPGAHCLTVFTQGNVAASRKQVAPALVTFFEKAGGC